MKCHVGVTGTWGTSASPQGCCLQQGWGCRDTCLWEGIILCPHQLLHRGALNHSGAGSCKTYNQGEQRGLQGKEGEEAEEERQKEKTDGKADKKVFTGWMREVMPEETLQFCFRSLVFSSGDLGQDLSSSRKPPEVTDVPAYQQPGGWQGAGVP